MSFDALAALHDDALEIRAAAKMAGERQPAVRIETLADGIYFVGVYVDGTPVASGSGASLDRAARKCRESLQGWIDDSPEGLAHALEVSIREVQGG